MADEERLVVALEARIRDFERNMQRAERTGTRTYSQLTAGSSRATRQMEQDVVRATTRINQALATTSTQVGTFGKAFGASLAGVLSVREVLKYADAWTTAKNSLAVAGVVGTNQVKVLDQLFQSAQRNAAPVQALADLFGKAAQASDNLGASQKDLLKFSGGVATALRVAGTNATAASGALTQLGQLLGSARVQAEEFNSVNEGARPILIAVAQGLEAAGGSVSKLKTLVNDGKVSSQEFFNAFLKGLPAIEAMAANSTQTIEQSWTKVNNALTKYIGETDSSLGASQRLVGGLNTLADNFDQTADRALQLASIVAGALVGRSIVGMIATLGKGTEALIAFSRALAVARTAGGLSTAFGGLGAVAGPVGLLIGGTVVTALTAFSSSSREASSAAKTYAQALEEIRGKAASAAGEIDNASQAIDEKLRNALTGGIKEGGVQVDEAKAAVLDLFRQIIDNAPRRLITEEQLQSLEQLRTNLDTGKLSADQVAQSLYGIANANPKFQLMADQLNPLLKNLSDAAAAVDLLRQKLGATNETGPTFRQIENSSMAAYEKMVEQADKFIKEQGRRAALTREQLTLETEIAKVRTEALKEGVTLTEKQIEQTARANVAGDKARNAEGGKTGRRKVTDYDALTRSVREHISALEAEAQSLGVAGQASTAYRVEQELLNDALSRGINVTPQMRDGFRQLAQEAGAAEEALNALKLSQDLVFERQQLGRTESEQRVYSELRSANIDINSATGERLANEIRTVEHLKEQKAVIDEMSAALSDIFTQPMREGEKFFDRLMSGFASIGRSFAQKGIDSLLKQWGISNPANAPAASPIRTSVAQTGREIGQLIAPVIDRNLNSTLTSYAAAIRKIESGSYEGNYSAIGPVTRNGDRAYGAYQVMGNNIASWTKEVVGQSLSIREFLANRAVQDRVFFAKFGQSIDKFGTAADATSVWFSGRPINKAGNSSDGYNTVPQYLSKVQAAVDGFPDGVRQSVASGVLDANRKMQHSAAVSAQSATGPTGFSANTENLMGAGGALIGAFAGGYQSGSPLMGGLSGAMSGLGAAPALSALGLGSMAGPVGLVAGSIAGRLGRILLQTQETMR
ncbi:hypothetical protein ASD54_10990 [Rhizobium sp. Root149]|uniref:tape measure protein n=1 Tax=Rhizobium sp. Root149 TaxID=1736473 RepID=UPI000714896B|nr:tape measure protein [Rhizobium sp. Root149]KQZ50727.1 hypothetical protein ASD54_10990 [Rhizobium sp. Root149]